MIENCLLWREKAKKNSAWNGGFRRERRFYCRFFTSILFSTKASAVSNFKAVTLLWAEIMHILLLVSKIGTSASPLYCLKHLKFRIMKRKLSSVFRRIFTIPYSKIWYNMNKAYKNIYLAKRDIVYFGLYFVLAILKLFLTYF